MLLAIMDMTRRVGRPTEPGGPQWISGAAITSRAVRRTLDRITGGIFVTLGVVLATTAEP
jgi:hypothetical protein